MIKEKRKETKMATTCMHCCEEITYQGQVTEAQSDEIWTTAKAGLGICEGEVFKHIVEDGEQVEVQGLHTPYANELSYYVLTH